MDAIAAAAKLTSDSLYKHFSGKSDLFASVMNVELQRAEGPAPLRRPRAAAMPAGRR